MWFIVVAEFMSRIVFKILSDLDLVELAKN